MEIGDTVTKTSDAAFRGTVVQLPRSVGRKRPRALVASLGGESWLHVDELKKVESVDT
jgi:hypothetical protein